MSDISLQLESATADVHYLGSLSLSLNRPGPELRIPAYEMLVNHLAQLGTHRISYFKAHGYLAALNEAISCFKQAVEATISEGGAHTGLPGLVAQYITALDVRFACCGDVSDLTTSVECQRQALDLTADDNPEKARLLCELGSSLGQRYACTGDITDIADAMDYLLRADTLTDDDYPFKTVILSNLGSSMGDRYSALGEIGDLETSIGYKQRALTLVRDDDPRKGQLLSNLALSQLKLFQSRDSLHDLDECIRNHADAINRTPEGHPMRLPFIHRMGAAKLTRFRRLGELDDLEDSITKFQQVVSSTNEGDPHIAEYMNDLGSSRHTRFLRLREVSDLEHALSIMRRSVAFLNDGHKQKPDTLANLAEAELSRFAQLKDPNDLEGAIAHMEQAITMTTHARPEWFSNLACTQQMRFNHLGLPQDLESAIGNLRTALRLTDSGHPHIPGYLSNLGDSLRQRYERLGGEVDLKEAIASLQIAVQSLADDHPEKVKCLYRLGKAIAVRYRQVSDPHDLEACISALRAASQARTTYPTISLAAAREWILVSHGGKDLESTLEAFKTALEILPKLAWLGLSTKSRQDWLLDEGSETLSTSAAACAIRLGRFETAVELLDAGRSIIWQQASSLRVDLERLREADPHLAEELDMLGLRLNTGNFADDTSYLALNGVDVAGNNRYRLVDMWEGLLDRVRKLPQFEHFLRPLPFKQLRKAAKDGHIVIVNVCPANGVDALIFCSDSTHPIAHVHLPDLDSQSLTEFSTDIILKRSWNDTAEQHRRYLKNFFKPALRTVWHNLVVPIFARMNISATDAPADFPKRRIWWYPTGPLTFFPIHAAGPSGAIDVSRLVVSSYISTVGSLLKAHQHKSKMTSGPPKLLAVSQPHTAGQSALPMCAREVDALKELASSAEWPNNDILHLNASEATISRVSAALDTSSHIHFACHGLQHPSLGMKSAFALHDGLLELGQIASKRVTTGRFAFLSVCHAAAGMRQLPSESMHLAAGLQFSGFPSVIGTMWSISDDDAPVIARHVYQYLLREGIGALDSEEAAVALNRAVLKLRENPNIPVDRWAPFIHLGI
ncbi:hypothetical protein FIBSPDRAFT_1040969 [Athelia psychrophila]|uniref:CHAT domain-containing protein n=1 Tax=Athelia psychrophila TaxID=1759441 RepID=A0A166PJR4_9AGAM|nr:hypothetical protein FIBSPDRAFT_1040969 [Fibularhizoctonia sp. CBS 109695]